MLSWEPPARDRCRTDVGRTTLGSKGCVRLKGPGDMPEELPGGWGQLHRNLLVAPHWETARDGGTGAVSLGEDRHRGRLANKYKIMTTQGKG